MLTLRTGTVFSRLSTRGREVSQSAVRSPRLEEASSWPGSVLPGWVLSLDLIVTAGLEGGSFAFLSTQSRVGRRKVAYHLGDEGGWSSSPASWLGPPESTRSLACELRPRLSQLSLSHARPFPGRGDSADVAGSGLGTGVVQGISCERCAGHAAPTQLAGRACLPARRGPAPPSPETCPPCTFAGRGKWGPCSQRNRVRVLAGHRSGLDRSQGLCEYSRGMPRPKIPLE